MTRQQILERLDALRAQAAEQRDEFRQLAELDELDEAQQARFDELAADDALEPINAEVSSLEQRLAAIDRYSAVPDAPARDRESGDDRTAPQHMRRTEVDVDPITAPEGEVRSAALATLERSAKVYEKLDADVQAHIERLIDTRSGDLDGDVIARRIMLTETDAYRQAFMAYLANPAAPAWTAEQARAVQQFRAGPQSLTGASGGVGVPVMIDPTIILTTGAADAPILRVARIEPVTTNVWKGVSSAPVVWSYDGEGTAVSDDSVTTAQPEITTYGMRAFVPYTIEIGQDYPSFVARMGRLIEQGYVDKIAAQSMTGTGSSQPFGIFTDIDANAAREVVVTTSGALGPEDVLTAWNHLGERWRSRATWFSSVSVESQVRVDDADRAGLYSVGLNAEGILTVNQRPYYTTDYAPAFTGTTGTVNLLVVGDFENFVIAQRAGMNVEAIPHLFDTTTGRPLGQRGLFAMARNGMGSTNDNAFALLKNAT